MRTHDVIVVGGGHHGLTCACYLARAGHDVLVLERNAWLGGMTYTRETVAAAPGFKMNPCAVDLLFTNMQPSIIDELRLESYGLRQISPDPWGAYVGGDGAALGLWRSLDRTVQEIRRHSRRDAERFAELCEMWCAFWRIAGPYMMDHPTRPSWRTLGRIARETAKGRRHLKPISHMLVSSPYQLIDELFESEAVRSLMAVYAAGSSAPLKETGSGAALGIIMFHIGWGIKRPVGGMGAFTAALENCLRAHGGQVRTDAPVERILVDDQGRQCGVRLASGEELRARQVVGALDPVTLLDGLVDGVGVPERTLEQLRAARIAGWNVNNAKVDVALERRPELACGRPELWGSYMLVGDGMDYVERAIETSMAGQIPAETPLWAVMPSAVDRTQVPPGSEGETLYLFAPSVPHRLSDGRSWQAERDAFGWQAVDALDRVAPGTRDAVIGHWTKSPDELRAMTHEGSLMVLDLSLNQMGPFRPTPALAGYRTPIDGLWHTGAGAHGLGGVNGWAGRTTSRLVGAALRK